MLDPLTALSVAATIVQFVDFGSKLVIEGYGAYKSVAGLSEESVEIQSLADNLSTLSASIAAFASKTSKDASPEDTALAQTARKCHGVGKELSDLIADLKLEAKGPMRSWEAVRQTVRKVRKKDKIERLQRQLDALKLHINTHLLHAVRSEQSAVAQAIKSLTQRSEALQVQNCVFLTDLRKDLLAHVEALNVDRKVLQRARRTDNAYASAVRSSESSTHHLIDTLNAMQGEGSRIATGVAILDSLRYPEMPIRYTDIRDAYPETFEWIFEEERTPFKTWLGKDSGIFWISGKAGSGKSTLMKFLDSHRKTRGTLDSWAEREGKTLLLASFYFWSAGYPMQRKQEGLLQSLLFQILRRVPHIISEVVPERWAEDETFHRNPDPWTRQELSDALQAILTRDETQVSTRFCFFIDGLDEFEGDPVDIVRDLNQIAASKTVKLCVSSRPWIEFRDAYSGDGGHMLVLQDLTRPDMDRFVRGMLEKDDMFVRLAEHDPRAQLLVTEILDKAQGVFLWVFLVVRSLLRGLGKHDGIPMLEERLKELPSDLEKYFTMIMDNIEPVYQDYAARLFQLAIRATPLPLIAISYLLDAKPEEFEPALSNPINPFYSRDAQELAKSAADCLNAWCRDLLEFHGPSGEHKPWDFLCGCNIVFLHRSVRDFMLTHNMQRWLNSHIKTDFSPWSVLLQIHVFQAKGLDYGHGTMQSVERFTRIANETMHYAREYEMRLQRTPARLINELDRIGNHIWPPQPGRVHWTFAMIPEKINFLAFAVANGLIHYVRDVLDANPQVLFTNPSWPLLDFALHEYGERLWLAPGWATKHAMVELLLERGADPNQVLLRDRTNRTPWHRFLLTCYHSQRGVPEFWDTAMLLIRNGARCDIKIEVGVSKQTVRTPKWKKEHVQHSTRYEGVAQCLSKCSRLSLTGIEEAISGEKSRQRPQRTRWLAALPSLSWPRGNGV